MVGKNRDQRRGAIYFGLYQVDCLLDYCEVDLHNAIYSLFFDLISIHDFLWEWNGEEGRRGEPLHSVCLIIKSA
jgi:hypothetical protein